MVFNLTWADNSPPVKGGKFPVINLPIPKNPNERQYLGDNVQDIVHRNNGHDIVQ